MRTFRRFRVKRFDVNESRWGGNDRRFGVNRSVRHCLQRLLSFVKKQCRQFSGFLTTVRELRQRRINFFRNSLFR